MATDVTYGTVLVPTDGSETAAEAIDHAVSIARQYDATLHTVYVIDTVGAGPALDAATIYGALEDQGREALREVEARAEAAGLEHVETELVEGAPHRGILDHAEDQDVDLVVMGTHGRSGLDRYLLGSVTEKVVRSADVPVLTVHGGEEGTDGGTATEERG